MTIKTVIKSDGSEVPFDASKLNKMAEWADNTGIGWSELVLSAVKKLTDKCTTKNIQEALIDACAEKQDSKHLDMAARLYLGTLYKEAHGGFENRPHLYDFYQDMLVGGVWEEMDYDATDLDFLNLHLDNDKDLQYKYSTIKQIASKYSKKLSGQVCETPQYTFMGIAMKVMETQPEDRRLDDVINLYTYLSDLKINAPTPFLAGLRTNFKGYASCALVAAEDTADSLEVSTHLAYKMTVASAGLGLKMNTRSVKDPVRGGEIEHTGKLPYYRYLEGAVKSTKQSTRGGSATVHYTILDPEIEDLLRLKHPTTVVDKQIRGLDYSVGVNRFFAEKSAKGEDWMLCSYLFGRDVHEAMMGTYDEFKAAYELYEASDSPKKYVNATSLLKTLLKQRQDTGRIYIHWLDEMNTHTPFGDKISQSNLCVAPETKILTRKGYTPIEELEGETLDIWNGEDWSEVTVTKTGEDQGLLKVETSSGYSLECTPYHRFYVFNGYGNPYKIRRTHELVAGDKLAKFDLPVINGTRALDKAYLNGFFSGDGCSYKGKNIVYLYHEKRELSEMFKTYQHSYYICQEKQNREVFHMEELKEKFFVPSEDYTVDARLEWLSGYLDADGCIYRNGTNEAITCASVELSFLKDLQMMLQTLGVSPKIVPAQDAGYKLLPANDGSGELKEFYCKEAWRLLISSYDSYRLLELGLEFNRLKIKKRRPQRDAKQFVKVSAVIDEGRVDDTYCFSEKKRGMGMFNGILTGQCKEIMLPTQGYSDVTSVYDEYSEDKVGEVALCFLSCLVAGRVSEEEYEDVAYYTTLMVDNVIDIMEYPFKQMEHTVKARRSIGIGITNLAHDLARRGLSYKTLEGKNYMHRLAEMHSYYIHKASLRLAKEKGVCAWIGKTKYKDGWTPLHSYNKNVDLVHNQDLLFDWEKLSKEIRETGGIRNSVLEATPPAESSSQASETTNSLYPIREGVVIKKSGSGITIFQAPEWDALQDSYELAWDIPTKDIVDCYAIFQKFHGQGISGDLWTDYSKYPDEKVPVSEMLTNFFYSTKMGLKSWYYQNSKAGIKEVEGSSIEDDDDDDGCESCKM
ncbi:ribonucleoside diphosphate reductase subunit alpha [Vibrio phage helene 12B3]|uniref:NrdA-like aerobic NDP reductase large subunit n=1 Tax=Vibrio phage helene 12B3 TaxID=573173 RepID=UPI0002C0BC16|nr:NrdA-like aerobic NDP reductase large subunit [Vibrio phage helene 12B3]AGG57940.1 ribonucleoside diphosphate reductase subunit alpha [Vibrio phage helene 12B3]